MNKISFAKTLIATFSLLLLASCSFTPQVCEAPKAYDLGYQDGEALLTTKPRRSEGAKCDGKDYSSTSFGKDYDAGFAAGLKGACTVEKAKLRAKNDVEAAQPSPVAANFYNACPSGFALKKVYKTEFVRLHCTAERFKKLGAEQGALKKEVDFKAYLESCPKVLGTALTMAGRKAHELALIDACSVSAAEEQGIQDARAGKDVLEGLRAYNACPANLKEKCRTTYRSAFSQSRDQVQKDEQITLEKQRQADEARIRQEQLNIEKAKLQLQIDAAKAAGTTPSN